jgi:hypothetical protein
MKIIGLADDACIVHAEKGELANLLGFYYYGSNGCPALKLGTVIDIHAMYGQLSVLAAKQSELADVAARLRAVAQVLETQDPIVRETGRAIAQAMSGQEEA